MDATDIFVLRCYNCKTPIGIIRLNSKILASNPSQGVNSIMSTSANFQCKIYCLNCLDKAEESYNE